MGKTISALVTLAIAMAGVFCVAAPASASEVDAFVAKINAARAAAGLSALRARADLDSVAARHSREMAANMAIEHNQNLPHEVRGWRELGENVGAGTTVAKIHDAFMRSTPHRANILWGAVNEIGVGIAYDAKGRMYVTQVFARRGASSVAPAPPSSSTSVAPDASTSSGSGVSSPIVPDGRSLDILVELVTIDADPSQETARALSR